MKRRARSEPLDDLPRAEIVFVGVGPDEIEVELVRVGFGEEVAAAGEVFQIEEFVFFEAMDGFDIALIGVSGGRDTHVLAVIAWGSEGKDRQALDRFRRLLGRVDEPDRKLLLHMAQKMARPTRRSVKA